MLPDELTAVIDDMPLAVIPAGLLEWHGNHLPLGQDGMKSAGICKELVKNLGGGVVLPTVYFGRPGFSSYTGTLTYTEALVNMIFHEHFYQLKKIGIKVIVLITGHYGPLQVECIKRAATNFAAENPDMRIIAGPEYEGVEVDGVSPADHAGIWETSMFWSFYPNLVYMDNIEKVHTGMKIYENPVNDYYREKEEWTWGNEVTKATPELGRKAVDAIVMHLSKLVRDALDEVK